MRSLRTILTAGALTTALSGCTSSSFGLTPQPNGDIVVTNGVTGAVLTTSQSKPFLIDSGSFSIGVYEKYFGGPYTVTITQWTANFSVPCFAAKTLSTTQQTNIVGFTSVNGAPITDPTQPSPCTDGETETATIADSKGHSVLFVYELTATVPQQSLHRRLGLK
jgi:hypothetical protein